MGFRNGAYATIWEVKPGNGNYSDVRISTSHKNKQTDQYETDFSGYVRFIGDAHKNVAGLGEKTRIKLGDCDVTNSYNKEKKITYTNCVVFKFELMDGSQPTNNSKEDFKKVPETSVDEELPFA